MSPVTPYLLLHGFLGAPAVFDSLALDRSRVYAPVLLGHQGSERAPHLDPAAEDGEGPPVPSLDLETLRDGDWGLRHGGFVREVDRLAAWARGRGFQRGIVCGYSLGARLALTLLLRHPSLVERAVLIGVHPGLSDGAARLQRLRADVELCGHLQREGTERFVQAWERLPLFASQTELAPEVRAAQRRIRTGHRAEELVHSLLHCGLGSMPDTRPGLSAVTARVTLVTGSLDHKFTALAREMRETLPRSELCVVPGVGHNVLLERPDVVRGLLG